MFQARVAPFPRGLRRRNVSRRGMTLLEMLIVVGLILLLIGIALPVLSRARESARRTTCLNNLRGIAGAILMYVSDNDGFLPFAAAAHGSAIPSGSSQGHQTADWIYWQPTSALANIGTGGIGKYLNLTNAPSSLATLQCPADDDWEARQQTANGADYYPFSYSLNALMSSGNYDLGGIASDLSNGAQPSAAVAKTLRNVQDAGDKILIYEEQGRSINDGNGILVPDADSNTTPSTDLLSLRHTSITVNNDTIIIGGPQNGSPHVPNLNAYGNVAFCDGHAESVSRDFAHSKAHYAPNVSVWSSSLP